ncbi:MAG: hypothetical protein IJY93_02960 [Clostridia bacterium]|nr:hypothetical protein [Clostridia bacterium]
MKGLIINRDIHGILNESGRLPITAQQIKDFPKQFEGTQVTDYFLAMCDSCAVFPSKTRTSFLDKYYQKIENGIEVDHSGDVVCKGAHHVFEVLGVDHIAEQVKGFREIGINPWLTFRMNDIHNRDKETSSGLTDFYHEHPEVRRIKFHPEFIQTNGDFAYDYTYEIVRNHYLDLIDESLDRYDVYGIELDWQRECCVFAVGSEYEGIEIMNQFIRDVDTIVHKYEEKYGHEIKFGVRVVPDIQINFDWGFNVLEWVQEGIVDLVTLAGRFESNDTDMPIKLWSTMLKPYNVKLAACIEMNIRPHLFHEAIQPNMETFAACAASAYSQGADYIYFYNYFHNINSGNFDRGGELSCDPNADLGEKHMYWSVINQLGDFDKVMKMNRRHIISIKDRLPLWKRKRGYDQLPVVFNRDASFKICVGDIPKNAELTVRIGFEDTDKALANLPRVFVNSEACEYIGAEDDPRWHQGGKLLSYKIPKSAHKGNMCPYVIVTEEMKAVYVEIYIKVTE